MSFCIFNRQTQQTLNMSYRTQVFGVGGQTSVIRYRINEGPWIPISPIYAFNGPTYTSILNITVNVNDKIDYYLESIPRTYEYGIGFNGSYFGASDLNTYTIISGTNQIYLNICSYSVTFTNIQFCPASSGA